MDDSYGTANTGGASLRAGDDAHILSKADKPAVAATPASHSMANGEEPELTGWRLALSRVAGLGLMVRTLDCVVVPTRAAAQHC